MQVDLAHSTLQQCRRLLEHSGYDAEGDEFWGIGLLRCLSLSEAHMHALSTDRMLQALMSGAAFNFDWFLVGLIAGYHLHSSVRCVVPTPLIDLTARFLQLTCIPITKISQPIEATSQECSVWGGKSSKASIFCVPDTASLWLGREQQGRQ